MLVCGGKMFDAEVLLPIVILVIVIGLKKGKRLEDEQKRQITRDTEKAK